MPTTTGACTSTDSSTPTSSRCQRSWSFVASRSGRPMYAVVPFRETTLIASGSSPNRRRMSATAMYGRDVRYRRRLEVLGRLEADMSCDRQVYPRHVDLSGTLPEDAAQDEQHVGRPLGKASHEVRIPLRAVRHIDPKPIALLDQAALEVAAHAVQHLELEAVRADPALASEPRDTVDHLGVVRRDAGIGIGAQEVLA